MMPLAALIHAGFSMTKVLRRITPSGGTTKPALSALLQPLVESQFPGIPSDFRRWSAAGARVRRALGVERTHQRTPDGWSAGEEHAVASAGSIATVDLQSLGRL